jgi:hypothetical protein
MTDIALESIKWTPYEGKDYCVISKVTQDRNHYFNNRAYLTKGVELTLKGSQLIGFREAYKCAHGEDVKCPSLVVIDRERLEAYLSYTHREGYRDVEDTYLGIVTDKNVLGELSRITKEKGLHWVPYLDSVYLVMIEACMAKGKEKDDYSSNWQGNQLSGTTLLLEGTALKEFKTLYVREYGNWPFNKTRSIRVGDWEHAYSYLVQGRGEVANTFQSMGATSIRSVALQQWSSEEDMVDRVFKLMELSPIKMQRELCIVNTLCATPQTRRLDALECLPPIDGGAPRVHVYEFKKGLITTAHVTETIAVKGYVHLVREKYPDSKVCLFLVGTDIEVQAKRMLDCMVGVIYLPLNYLLGRILSSILSSWPREGHYQLKHHFLSKYHDILDQDLLSGNTPPHIITSYLRPLSDCSSKVSLPHT